MLKRGDIKLGVRVRNTVLKKEFIIIGITEFLVSKLSKTKTTYRIMISDGTTRKGDYTGGNWYGSDSKFNGIFNIDYLEIIK